MSLEPHTIIYLQDKEILFYITQILEPHTPYQLVINDYICVKLLFSKNCHINHIDLNHNYYNSCAKDFIGLANSFFFSTSTMMINDGSEIWLHCYQISVIRASKKLTTSLLTFHYAYQNFEVQLVWFWYYFSNIMLLTLCYFEFSPLFTLDFLLLKRFVKSLHFKYHTLNHWHQRVVP